jgi:RNA polymerase sigma factor (sigma-70 family)
MPMANAVLAERSECARERTDHQLVSAVRKGDDRAFEELYSRYQRRIAAYVCGMVKDYGRAEDITQEVFVSALRRMRQTERPIAFKPWIYEIAKNACIDAYRRGRRAEEVSYDADDRLSPSDHVRLVATGPEPDAAVDAKLELDNLCGAFGGLSESHHEILVLRELEGLSYKDIGARMGMSRPAVESTLFRARKRLGEEYDELASGTRCLRIQGIIARGGHVGRRDGQKLARHLSHCQPCRRLAASAGLELPVRARRRRMAEKVAGLLPLPVFLRARRGGDEAASALSGGGGGWMTHVPSFADAANSAWSKGAAGIAALLLAGAGVSTITESDKRDERGTGYQQAPAQAGHGGDAPARSAAPAGVPGVMTLRARPADGRERVAERRRGGDAGRPGAGARERGTDTTAAGGAGPAASNDAQPLGGGGGGAGGGGAGVAPLPGGQAPAPEAPQAPSIDPPQTPRFSPPSIPETTEGVTGALPDVNQPIQAVAPDAPEVPDPAEVTAPVTEAVDEATDDLLP